MKTNQAMWMNVIAVVLELCKAKNTIEFVTGPAPTAVLLGQDLSLNCSAQLSVTSDPLNPDPSPAPPLVYQWKFNDLPIETSLSKALLFQNHSLFVPRVGLPDLGHYQCDVWPEDSPQSTQSSGPVSVVQAYVEQFIIHPQSDDLFESNKTMLECVTGYSAPPAEVYWQKDGQRFSPGVQAVVRFGTVAPGGAVQQSLKLEFTAAVEHAGSFRCVAENPLSGQVEKSDEAVIYIQAPQRLPYITVNLPPELMLAEDSRAVYTCPIRGWPLPQITWYQDGTAIENTGRRYLLENGSLYFDPVSREDGGRFACIGANVLGSTATLSTNITISYLEINFLQQPTDLTVVAGQQVTLPCQPPNSYPEAKILWYRNTELVQERTGSFALAISAGGELVFQNVQMEDSGEYSCVAHNEFSVPESRSTPGAKLTVEGSPQFIQPPTDVTVIKGDLVTLTCKVKGQPQPAMAWFKNDQLILPSSRFLMRQSGQELLIPDSNRLDEGHYQCTASNVYGTARSQLVFLNVIVPPQITTAMRNQVVTIDDSILLPCGFYGDPVPEILWYKGDSEVVTSPGTGHTATPEGLLISVVTADDEGVYRCVAKNPGGEKQQSAFLDVQAPPTFLAFPVDKTVNVSQSVIYYCQTSGDPKPSISWKFNDTNVLPAGIDISDDLSTLIIQSVGRVHSGTYRCVSENALGQVSQTGVLTVQERAHVDNIQGETTINHGANLDLHCKVKGTPRPDITWTKDDRILDPRSDTRVTLRDNGSRLHVDYVSGSDSGVYRCLAKNPAGSDSRSVQVFVRETPLPPFLNHTHPVSMFSINISWIPFRQDLHMDVQAYVVQYKKTQMPEFLTFRDNVLKNATNLEVDGLSPATEYLFRVAAKNSVGIGGYSRVLGGKTLESAPGQPRNLELQSQNATSLSLRWEVPGATHGDIHQYQLQYRAKYHHNDFQSVDIAPPTLPLQRHTLGGLVPYTTYEVRVRAANMEQGHILWGQFTDRLLATTAMMAPSRPPQHVLLSALSSSKVKVTWQLIPANVQHGALQGYVIFLRLADSNEPITEIQVGPTATETILSDLSPWRYYEVSAAGYNAAGVGVRSDISRVRTGPQVPSGPPEDVRAQAVSATSARVSWKEVPLERQRSEISGYLVLYKDVDSGEELSEYVADPKALSTILSNLSPWTVYSIKVQAFTTQVDHGFGPFSVEQRIRTREDVPSHVSDLKVMKGSQNVLLSWQPPTPSNGIVKSYVVIVTKEKIEDTSGGREKRSLIYFDQKSNAATQAFELSGADMSVSVTNLAPGAVYHLAVAARTSVGTGEFANRTVAMETSTESPSGDTTIVADPITSAIPTMVEIPFTQQDLDLEVQTPASTDPSSAKTLHSNEMVGVIVGSVVGGLLVLSLLVLLVIICCCRTDQDRGTYVHSNSSQTTTEPATSDLGPHEREKPQYFNISVSGATKSSAPNPASHAKSSRSPDRPPPSSNEHHRHRKSTGNGSPVQATQNEGNRRNSGSPKQRISESREPRQSTRGHHSQTPAVFTVPFPPAHTGFSDDNSAEEDLRDLGMGFQNLGFESENNLNQATARLDPREAVSRRLPHIQPNISVRNSKRMQRNAAAAIAVQRNRESSVFHDLPDTDALLHDSVIVYNERTAL